MSSSFLDYFSFKALDLGDFRGISKNKKCGKGRGGCGGQQDFLEEENVDFLMEMCKNEGDRFQCFFVNFLLV